MLLFIGAEFFSIRKKYVKSFGYCAPKLICFIREEHTSMKRLHPYCCLIWVQRDNNFEIAPVVEI